MGFKNKPSMVRSAWNARKGTIIRSLPGVAVLTCLASLGNVSFSDTGVPVTATMPQLPIPDAPYQTGDGLSVRAITTVRIGLNGEIINEKRDPAAGLSPFDEALINGEDVVPTFTLTFPEGQTYKDAVDLCGTYGRDVANPDGGIFIAPSDIGKCAMNLKYGKTRTYKPALLYKRHDIQ